MRIKLGEVELAQGSKDDGVRHQKLRTILSISIKDKRNLVEQKIPGSSGNRLQDNGPEPVEISLEGEIYGEEASDTIKEIYKIYEAGEALPFHSDLTAIADVSKVMIENLQVNKSIESASHYGYTITLKGQGGQYTSSKASA